MHHDFLDRYSRLTSPIHRLPTPVKLCITVAIVAMLVLLPAGSWYFIAGIAFLIGLSMYVSTVPVSFIAKRLLLFEPFIIVIATLALFQHGGFIKFGTIVLKSTLSLIAVLLFSNTTPFSDLLRFIQRIRIPAVFVTILALMYRYVFILVDETERIQRARRSRTFSQRTSGSWIILSGILGELFVRSTERAERIFAAMSARGWK